MANISRASLKEKSKKFTSMMSLSRNSKGKKEGQTPNPKEIQPEDISKARAKECLLAVCILSQSRKIKKNASYLRLDIKELSRESKRNMRDAMDHDFMFEEINAVKSSFTGDYFQSCKHLDTYDAMRQPEEGNDSQDHIFVGGKDNLYRKITDIYEGFEVAINFHEMGSIWNRMSKIDRGKFNRMISLLSEISSGTFSKAEICVD